MYDPRRALAELRASAPIERTLLMEAALLLPAVLLIQTVLPFRRWRVLLTRPAPRAIPRDRPTPATIARAVDRARRHVPGQYRCLPVAYSAHLLLHRHGHGSRVHVGVAHDSQGKVEAHAWVECEGRVLVGDLPDLKRFVSLPALEV